MTFYYWQSKNDDKWYWRLRSDGNGEIVAIGGEGFNSKQACVNSIGLVRRYATAASIVETTG